MNKFVRQILALVILLPLALSAYAQPARYVAGTHYIEISVPVRTADAAKIEVVEAFWYGCSHCFRFEPVLNNWVAGLQDDVFFARFPAQWNELMKVHAQIFYAAEAMGVVDIIHEPVFEAINIQGSRLQSEDQIGDLFAKLGINKAEFSTAFNSFAVRTKVNQSDRRMQDYQIRSTPNMIVNGKYIITTGEAVPTQEEMLNVVDFLIAKERQAKTSG